MNRIQIAKSDTGHVLVDIVKDSKLTFSLTLTANDARELCQKLIEVSHGYNAAVQLTLGSESFISAA